MDFSKIKNELKLEQISPADLFLPENFESVKYQAYNLIDYLDWDGALIFTNVLGKKLSQIAPENKQQARIHTVLSYWAMRLLLFVYSNLKMAEKKDLIRNHIVYILDLGLDIKRALINFLDIFDSVDIIKDETNQILFDLNNNQENLGDPEKFSQLNFKPTVANWLIEYQIVVNSFGMKLEPGAFHIVKFIDSNQHVKYLTPKEKDALRDLLDFYNWLLSPLVFVDSKKASNNILYSNSQQFELPKELRQEDKVVNPPIIPAPKNQPTQRPMEEIAKISNSKLQISDQDARGLAKPLVKPVNIEEILKKKQAEENSTSSGLRMWNSNPPEMPKKPTVDIDKKLEDLKKKVQK